MPIPGLSEKKCQQRNRIAARRSGLEAVPFRFFVDGDVVSTGGRPARSYRLMSDEDALARINASLPDGAEPLTLANVYVHYAEAANSNFVSDRYCFLGTSTLRNIVTDANAGFAFMNSHRTGGFSTASELPYGRSFAGSYEMGGDADECAVVGFYMLRDIQPNGPDGPSTDDLHAMIDGGTLFDVSVGLYGGMAVCDVCGNDLMDYDACDHYPGTTSHMSEDEMDIQRMRGIADGCASYTLEDARCGELSGVFDGAVPGAGFRKTLFGTRKGALDKPATLQARRAYAQLLTKGEIDTMDEKNIIDAIKDGFAALGEKLGMKPAAPPPAAPVPPSPGDLAATSAELAQYKAGLDAANAQIEALQKQREEDLRQARLREDLAWIDAKVKSFHIMPAQREKLAAQAESNPAAFEMVKEVIEANGPVMALSGNPLDPASVAGGARVADGIHNTTEGDTLLSLAKKYEAEHGVSFVDAFQTVCRQNPQLANAHRSQVGG